MNPMQGVLCGSSNLYKPGIHLGWPYFKATNVQKLMKKQGKQYKAFATIFPEFNEYTKIFISFTNNSIHYDTHLEGWHCPTLRCVSECTKEELIKINKVLDHKSYFIKDSEGKLYCIFDPDRVLDFEAKLTEFFLLLKGVFNRKNIRNLEDKIIVLPPPPRHTYRCCAQHKPVSRQAAERLCKSIYSRVIEKINRLVKTEFIRLDSNDKFIAHILVTQRLSTLLTKKQISRLFTKSSGRIFLKWYHNKHLQSIIFKKILQKRDNFTHFKPRFNKVLSDYIRLTFDPSFNPVKVAKDKFSYIQNAQQ